MFITPNSPSLQFAARKKQPAPAPVQQPKSDEVKPLPVSKSVEKQLKKLADEFGKNLDQLKKDYQFYTTLVDEKGLRLFSESSIVEEIRQNMNRPPMTTQALNEGGFPNMVSQSLDESGNPVWNISESLSETGGGR
jgi:hypothetical protein